MSLPKLRAEWAPNVTRDLLAGTVVALALIPEAIAFSIIARFLCLGDLMRFVSRSVVTGFVNALAILIFLAQMPEAIGTGWQVYAMIAVGLAIICLLPRVTNAVPSALVTIVLLTVVTIGCGWCSPMTWPRACWLASSCPGCASRRRCPASSV